MIGSKFTVRVMPSIRNRLLVLVFAGMAVTVPGLAQEATDYPAPCDAAKVTKSDVDRAHTVFLSGKQYLEESNYDKAISYFKDAYSIDCSVHGMLPIIATAYERKGDKAEAVRALEEYLKRAQNPPDHDVIERRIRNLKDQLSREPPPPSPAASSASAPPAASSAPEAPAPTSATAWLAPARLRRRLLRRSRKGTPRRPGSSRAWAAQRRSRASSSSRSAPATCPAPTRNVRIARSALRRARSTTAIAGSS